MKLLQPRGSADIVQRDQHAPVQAPIDAYGDGGFRFAGISHRGSILSLPSGIHGWPVEAAAGIDLASLAAILAEAEAIDLLLIGCGPDLVPLPAPLRQTLRDAGISADPMSTGAAVRHYNILLGERRRVAAALIAVQ